MIKNLLLNDKFILCIILLNIFVIFAEEFITEIKIVKWFHLSDSVFILFFLLEAIIKIRHLGVSQYFRSFWNIFDFSLVVLAMPSLLVWIFNLDLPEFHSLLDFRIMRVFRFFRLLHFIPKIDKTISGIGRAIRVAVPVIFAFFIFNFIISLISCSLFKKLAPEFFNDPLISFYSIFKIFTVEGWYSIPDVITANTSPTVTFFVRLYFIMILFGGGVFGLSLINSIFVEAMTSDNNDVLEKKVVELQEKIDALIKHVNKQNT